MTQLTQEQLAGANIKLPMGEKQKTLDRLIREKWLGENDLGHITIGVRHAQAVPASTARAC
jgi:Nse1 non-SMC component of SMC5-6 complex